MTPPSDPGTEIDATFEILEQTEESYDEPALGPKLTRVVITKRYRGAIEGSGVAHVLTAQGDGGAGYVASERIVGRIGDRQGTFVIQHGGLADVDAGTGEVDQSTWGSILPGSATGDLAGLRGSACEAQLGVLTLRCSGLPVDPSKITDESGLSST